jgi:hypothetical protein
MQKQTLVLLAVISSHIWGVNGYALSVRGWLHLLIGHLFYCE